MSKRILTLIAAAGLTVAGLTVTGLTVAACGSSGGSGGGGGNNNGGVKVDGGSGNTGFPDGMIGGPDSGSSGDLGTSSKLGCNGFTICLSSEFQSNGGDFAAAESTCTAKSKAGTTQKWEALVGCGQQYCLTANKCKLNATQDRLVNLDGSAPNDGTPCGDCLANSLSSAFGEACPNPSSPDCTPTACQSELDACQNDLP